MMQILSHYKQPIRTILLSILVFVAGWFLIAYIVSERTEELMSTIEVQVAEQRALLVSIAEATARNGADQATEQIIRDCRVDERTRFDELLSRLDKGLHMAELSELELLFGRCGSFFAERKLVMSARLDRELALYENYITQLSAISGSDVSEAYAVTGWRKLAEQERNLSTEFFKLVEKQDQIISTLRSGKARDSAEIQSILSEVNEIQNTLIILNTQTATLRSEVIQL